MNLRNAHSTLLTVPIILSGVITASVLAQSALAQSALAQTDGMSRRELQELYNLCSRSPYNSRCEGLEIPVTLDGRLGEVAGCSLWNGTRTETGDCKVRVEGDRLLVYMETGEPIELLNNQLGTIAVEIPTHQIFAQNYQIWSVVHRLEFGFVPEPIVNQDYRTNSLNILTNEALAVSLQEQLNIPSLNRSPLDQVHSSDQVSSMAGSATPALVERLLETRSCVRCNLQGADLAAADLEDVNLEGANLEGANLQGAKLEGAYLVGANLNNATLTEADLGGVNFTFATLQGAVLDRANLKAVNFQGANLQDASLQEARLIAPAFLYQANLENANLSNVRLEGANLESANLAGANLTNANLSDVNVNISGIPGNDYEFGERLLDALVLPLPFFSWSEGGVEFNTNLNGANLRNANLTGADLEQVSWQGADLSGANLTGAQNTELTDANLCGATMPDGSRSNQGC
jgi:uncharacterized protein YjbI with pentapeptide repeats